MDGSLEMGALGAGSPQTLCALPTMSWLSTGMSCRTRRLARSQRVACLCLVIASRIDHRIRRTTAIEDEEAHSPAWFPRSALGQKQTFPQAGEISVSARNGL